jgi:hypothetical protein
MYDMCLTVSNFLTSIKVHVSILFEGIIHRHEPKRAAGIIFRRLCIPCSKTRNFHYNLRNAYNLFFRIDLYSL